MKKILDLVTLTPEHTCRLNEIAEIYRKKYTEYTDDISEQYKENAYWWATPIAGRSISESDLFLNICKVRLAIENLPGDYEEIVVPNSAIKKDILSNVHCDIPIRIINNGIRSILHRIAINVDILGILRNVFKLCMRLIYVRLYSSNGRNIENEHKPEFMICCYRMLSEFSDGIFSDRYMTGLEELTDRRIIYLDTIYFNNKEGKQIVDRVSKLKGHYICEQFFGLKDIIVDTWNYYLFCRKLRIDNNKFDGMNIKGSLELSIKESRHWYNSIYGLLRGRAASKLITKFEESVKALIEWNEGQTLSNAMLYAVRTDKPNILTVAYTYGALGENWLQSYPSAGQVDNKAVAEVYAVHGVYWKEAISQFSAVRSIICPSFRHTCSMKDRASEIFIPNSIIVILPMSVVHSRQLLTTLSEAIDCLDYKPRVFIKNHPAYSHYTIEDYGVKHGGIKHATVEYVYGDFIEAISDKETVLMSCTTSTLDVLLLGGNVINYIPAGELINLFIPKDLYKYIHIAYSPLDIVHALDTGSKGIPMKHICEIREKAYTDVNRDTVGTFFYDIEKAAELQRKEVG